MAAPPDISSILAALANQGRNTTPGQPAQPYQQPPAPNAYQQQQPTAPPAGLPTQYPPPQSYGMPQTGPVGGNYDMNAMRAPGLSAVNISDAIAQAKAFAAEKGLTSYERPPQNGYPAYQPHDDRNYRGRSRSPPSRRDAYRDNFNPYRDERRDERGNHARDYGRDRSMSPGHSRGRQVGTFSPRRGGRDRADDDNSEIMEIESSLVGLIIGRQGENLKRIESDTGCRVQFLSPAGEPGAFRQCKITGPTPRRAEARAAMNRIIEDSGMGAIARAGLDKTQPVNRNSGGYGSAPPIPAANAGAAALRDGEECVQIMVPDRTVGLIIGRGGETIRDLQERSGCHINIVGESKSVNGLRPVNLIGPYAAASQAKELILEIVHSDTREGASQETNMRSSMPKNDHVRQTPQGGNDKINDSIYVPSEAVGMIIGKGGETIREMQNTTGCKINVSQPSGPNEVEREIGLVGSRDSIARAKQAIEDKVEAVRQKNSGGGRGGRPQNRRDWDNPNSYAQGANNHGHSNHDQPSAADSHAAPAGNQPDPYAPYGGYQAYLNLWYAALANPQAGGQAGEMPKPPGA